MKPATVHNPIKSPDLTPVGERDGCGCPPHVLRCAHWDGQILILVDTDSPGAAYFPHTCHGGASPWDRQGYSIHRGPQFVKCQRSDDCPALCLQCERQVCLGFGDDLAAAEAEFHRRELELLGREP